MKKQRKQPAKRGGARPGAGRPPAETPRISVGVRLDPENRAWVEAEAARLGCSMSDVVNRLIEGAR